MTIKPDSQYDGRLSFCFVSNFRQFVSFRRVVHIMTLWSTFLNFDPSNGAGRAMGLSAHAH